MSCRRRWTCTCHSRKKSKTACPLPPSPCKLRLNPKARPQSPQSTQSPANRRWDSKFFPRHSFSRRLRPRYRNNKLPAACARLSPPARALHEVARSSATSAPEIVLRRTASACPVQQIAEPTQSVRIEQLEMRTQCGAVSRLESPGNRQALPKIDEYISAA